MKGIKEVNETLDGSLIGKVRTGGTEVIGILEQKTHWEEEEGMTLHTENRQRASPGRAILPALPRMDSDHNLDSLAATNPSTHYQPTSTSTSRSSASIHDLPSPPLTPQTHTPATARTVVGNSLSPSASLKGVKTKGHGRRLKATSAPFVPSMIWTNGMRNENLVDGSDHDAGVMVVKFGDLQVDQNLESGQSIEAAIELERIPVNSNANGGSGKDEDAVRNNGVLKRAVGVGDGMVHHGMDEQPFDFGGTPTALHRKVRGGGTEEAQQTSKLSVSRPSSSQAIRTLGASPHQPTPSKAPSSTVIVSSTSQPLTNPPFVTMSPDSQQEQPHFLEHQQITPPYRYSHPEFAGRVGEWSDGPSPPPPPPPPPPSSFQLAGGEGYHTPISPFFPPPPAGLHGGFHLHMPGFTDNFRREFSPPFGIPILDQQQTYGQYLPYHPPLPPYPALPHHLHFEQLQDQHHQFVQHHQQHPYMPQYHPGEIFPPPMLGGGGRGGGFVDQEDSGARGEPKQLHGREDGSAGPCEVGLRGGEGQSVSYPTPPPRALGSGPSHIPPQLASHVHQMNDGTSQHSQLQREEYHSPVLLSTPLTVATAIVEESSLQGYMLSQFKNPKWADVKFMLHIMQAGGKVVEVDIPFHSIMAERVGAVAKAIENGEIEMWGMEKTLRINVIGDDKDGLRGRMVELLTRDAVEIALMWVYGCGEGKVMEWIDGMWMVPDLEGERSEDGQQPRQGENMIREDNISSVACNHPSPTTDMEEGSIGEYTPVMTPTNTRETYYYNNLNSHQPHPLEPSESLNRLFSLLSAAILLQIGSPRGQLIGFCLEKLSSPSFSSERYKFDKLQEILDIPDDYASRRWKGSTAPEGNDFEWITSRLRDTLTRITAGVMRRVVELRTGKVHENDQVVSHDDHDDDVILSRMKRKVFTAALLDYVNGLRTAGNGLGERLEIARMIVRRREQNMKKLEEKEGEKGKERMEERKVKIEIVFGPVAACLGSFGVEGGGIVFGDVDGDKGNEGMVAVVDYDDADEEEGCRRMKTQRRGRGKRNRAKVVMEFGS